MTPEQHKALLDLANRIETEELTSSESSRLLYMLIESFESDINDRIAGDWNEKPPANQGFF